MRSPNKNTEIKYENLISCFREGKRLSIADIMVLLDCNRQSAYNYLNRYKISLLGTGSILLKKKEGKTAYYSLQSNTFSESISEEYESMSVDTIRKYYLAQELQRIPRTAENLASQCSEEEFLDFGKTTATKYINELLSEGEIRKNPVDKKLTLTGKTISPQLDLSDDEIFRLLDLVENTPPGSPYYKALLSIYKKLELQLGTMDANSPTYSNFVIYGRQHSLLSHLPQQFSSLTTFDYRKKVLKVTYARHNKQPLQIHLAIGLVVYSEDKDDIYIIGKKFSPEKETFVVEDVILLLTSLQAVEETHWEHSFYQDGYYMKIFEEMFSISVEPIEKVVVRIQATPNLERKFKTLAAHRHHSTLTTEAFGNQTKLLTYTDSVRGLSDFAAFLRQFSWSVTVLGPQALRDKMKFSIHRSLEAYTEGEVNE